MAFELHPHPAEVQAQIEALPDVVRADFEAAIAFILAAPFASPPYLRSRPDGLRRREFGLGLGLVVYQIRFDDKVQIELVHWLG